MSEGHCPGNAHRPAQLLAGGSAALQLLCPGVSDAWSNVAAFVPKFAVFLLILIVGYLIAKAIAKILSKVLTRVGFDRLVERGGVKRALDRSSYDASGFLAKIVYYAIMLFVLSTAFGVFGSNPISDYLRGDRLSAAGLRGHRRHRRGSQEPHREQPRRPVLRLGGWPTWCTRPGD